MSHKLNHKITVILTGMEVKHTILNGTENHLNNLEIPHKCFYFLKTGSINIGVNHFWVSYTSNI